MTYHDNIEKQTLENTDFRRVIFTAKNQQLVLMSLKPGEEIGEEVHDDIDQFFRIEQGEATFVVDGKEFKATDGYAVIVKAGSKHNVISSGDETLKLYTI